MGELELISKIKDRIQKKGEVLIGIGDDAALLKFVSGKDSLVTVDMLMDRVHFDLTSTDPERIGYKSLAVNLSDIAAMGGIPVAALP